MSFLFDRYCELTVDLPTERRIFTDFRVAFNIEKTSESNANRGTISIFNLNETSRGLISSIKPNIILEVGYKSIPEDIEGTRARKPLKEIIAKGNVEKVWNERKGIDYITNFEFADGGIALYNASLDKSYGANISAKQIVTELIDSFGVVKGVVDESINFVFKKGYAASGQSKAQLDVLSKKLGYEWSIQDGEIQFLKSGGSTNEEAIFLSPENGLLGTPAKKDKGIECKCLLNPQIRPGRKIIIESASLNGTFTVRKCVYQGDSKEGDFICSIEAI